MVKGEQKVSDLENEKKNDIEKLTNIFLSVLNMLDENQKSYVERKQVKQWNDIVNKYMED